MGGGEGSGWRGWGQGGCDQRIEVFGKLHPKKIWGGGGGRVGRVRVDVNEELKFEVFEKIQKKKKWGEGPGGGGGVMLGGQGG